MNPRPGSEVAQVLVRDFRSDDQEPVRRLVLRGLLERWGDIDKTLNTDLDDIASTYADDRTIVAEIGGGLVGTGTLRRVDPTTSEIVRMSVPEASRRLGIGRLIVEELIRTARTWGSTKVVLETQSSWHDAIAFYLACGFRIAGASNGEFGEDTLFELAL